MLVLTLTALASAAAADPAAPSFSRATAPIWASANASGGVARHVLLRPSTMVLATAPASLSVLVAAAPDVASQSKVLGLYKLWVNDVLVGVGPGRGERPLGSALPVFDVIDVPAAALQAAGADPRQLSVAVHCLNWHAGSAPAWLRLEAVARDAAGGVLASLRTGDAAAAGGAWQAYAAADGVWVQGVQDTGGGAFFINEDIDAAALARIDGWRGTAFDPRSAAGWAAAAVVPLGSSAAEPVAKTTLPLQVETDVLPFQVLQLAKGHYFFDFGRERTGALTLAVSAATAALWGGAGGAKVEVRAAEQLGLVNKHSILYPATQPWDPGNWNKIPKWSSTFTLPGDVSTVVFEQHEYLGLFRWGEIIVKANDPLRHPIKDAGLGFNLSMWSVHYPWSDEAHFASSDGMLDAVWSLCRDTLRYTSLDTFTDSNVRERMPYEADGYMAARLFWALRSETQWVRHSAQFVLNNPTWPTDWLQYSVLLAHGHWMDSGDLTLADENFEQLVNNSMFRFVDGGGSELVDFTASQVGGDGNSPLCHNDSTMFPPGVNSGGGKRCDNIDWLPKFRAGYKFTTRSSIINAFAVHAMEMLAELAGATGRASWMATLSAQAARTRAAALATMYNSGTGMWCDGVCADKDGGHVSFHPQHFALSLGLTPDAGVSAALAYLQREGMVGSTYSAHSLVRGLFERAAPLDYGATALALLTSCAEHSWCRMLRANATTTWEHWEPHDGTHSHVWSATPAANIASGLMGVVPTAPGWRMWSARPAPGNLSAARIGIPTPHGIIVANFSRRDTTQLAVRLAVDIPLGTTARLCVPLFGTSPADVTLTLDGAATSAGRVDFGGAYLCVDGLAPASSLTRRVVLVAARKAEPRAATPPPLQRLNIDPRLVSVSGLSAGADFAVSMQVAFSASIMGLGVFAGQAYHCGVTRFPEEATLAVGDPGACTRFCENCEAGQVVPCDHCKHSPNATADVAVLVEAARGLAAAGRIDGVGNLSRAKIYTYCGTNDGGTDASAPGHFGATVHARDFFAQLVPQTNLLWNFSIPSGHAWPEDYGVKKCGDEIDQGLWTLENCGYDGPGELLQHIYGPLAPRAPRHKPAHLLAFDQAPFNGDDTAAVRLGPKGLVYVPAACAAGAAGAPCALHVSLHGCSNPWVLQDQQAKSLSFVRWAETNSLVVLFPHLGKLGGTQPGGYNVTRNDCFDGYAFEGDGYDTKEGPQMAAIAKMIETVSGASLL